MTSPSGTVRLTVAQATVRFLDEGGAVIPDVDGNDLTAAVNVMVQ